MYRSIADVFESLYHVCELDAGTALEAKGEKLFVCLIIAVIRCNVFHAWKDLIPCD